MSDERRELREVLAEVAEQVLGDGHPSEEKLVAHFEGRLEGAEREQLLDHLAACGECVDFVEELEAFHDAADEEETVREGVPVSTPVSPTPGPDWRRRLLRWAPVAAVLLLAVIVPPLLAPDEPLPGYEIRVDGGVSSQRSGDADRVFPAGSRLELLLRPADPVPGALDVRVWRRTPDGFGPVSMTLEIGESGTATLAGRLGETIDLPPGDQDLLVVLGHESKLPSASELDRLLGAESEQATDDWVAWRVTIRVEG